MMTCGGWLTLLGLVFAADQDARGPEASVAALQRSQQIVFRHALEAVSPYIVKIETIGGALPVRRSDDPLGPKTAEPSFRQADGPTTGVVWSADGYILSSSFNFIRDPSVITITLADGRRFVAKLIARDRPARLALLKIEADNLPVPRWLPRDQLRPGQWALVAGFGHGSETPALSVGILSALRRASGLALQIDAKTSPANYGGPVFDIEGRLLGLCVPIAASDDEIAGIEWYDSGIGFAIDADLLARRVPRLQRGQDVQRGFMGVTLDMRDRPVGMADAPAGEEIPADGVRLLGDPRGPAAAAGLRKDDVITHVDEMPTPRWLILRRLLAEKEAGDEVVITYRRGEEFIGARLTLVAQNQIAPEPASRPASQPK